MGARSSRPPSPTPVETPSAILRLTFIRHAQSEMNLKTHLVCGRSNHSPLTEKGRQQALLAADRLAAMHAEHPFDHILCSPAVRTQSTVAPLAEKLGMRVNIDDRLQELDQGSLTGDRPRNILFALVLNCGD
jgi:probable phosphoglycerate mutase